MEGEIMDLLEKQLNEGCEISEDAFLQSDTKDICRTTKCKLYERSRVFHTGAVAVLSSS